MLPQSWLLLVMCTKQLRLSKFAPFGGTLRFLGLPGAGMDYRVDSMRMWRYTSKQLKKRRIRVKGENPGLGLLWMRGMSHWNLQL